MINLKRIMILPHGGDGGGPRFTAPHDGTRPPKFRAPHGGDGGDGGVPLK